MYVYGGVSPEVVEVQVNALPEVAPDPQPMLLTSGLPATLTGVEADALLLALPSPATTLIVWLPFEEHVTLMLLVVDEPVHAAGRVHV